MNFTIASDVVTFDVRSTVTLDEECRVVRETKGRLDASRYSAYATDEQLAAMPPVIEIPLQTWMFRESSEFIRKIGSREIQFRIVDREIPV